MHLQPLTCTFFRCQSVEYTASYTTLLWSKYPQNSKVLATLIYAFVDSTLQSSATQKWKKWQGRRNALSSHSLSTWTPMKCGWNDTWKYCKDISREEGERYVETEFPKFL